MATHKQALKRHRQSLKRNERNTYYKSTVRTYLRQAREALAAGDASAATPVVRKATAFLDRVASKGIIPANRASRVKGRLTKQLAALAG